MKLKTFLTKVLRKYLIRLHPSMAMVLGLADILFSLIQSRDIEKISENILVLQNWLERIRKEVTNKVLSIKRISEFLNFPILAQPTLKKI